MYETGAREIYQFKGNPRKPPGMTVFSYSSLISGIAVEINH